MPNTPSSPRPTIPGTGLSYTDLCNADRRSEVRTMWRALSEFADVLGIPTYASGLGMRTKTTDEFLADIREVVEEGFDIPAAALATLALTPEVPQHETRYEVRRLAPNGMQRGTMNYLVEETADSYEAAAAIKTRYEEAIPDAIVAVVRVEVTTQVTVYPDGYTPRL